MSLGRILLVDDDPVLLKLNRARLCDAGYAVETATGAEDALQKAGVRAPDAVVSDVLMGDLDGFALCGRLREQPSLAAVPVILLSSHYRGAEDEQFATRVGASALVTRTPEFDDELATLQRCLAERSPPVADVVDRGLYEEHLRKNAKQLVKLAKDVKTAEERYRILFESATDTITFLTPDGVILDANARWQELIGIAPEQMIGRHIREFAAAGKEDENVEGYQQTIAAGAGRNHAVPIRCQDGRTIYMEFAVTVHETDGEPLVSSIGRDVTSSVLAARSLAVAEERHRSLLERLPDVIWTATAAGAFTFITPNVLALTGFTAEEMCAEDMDTRLSRVHPEDRDGIRKAVTALIQDRVPFDLEYRRQCKDGHWVWLRTRSIAVYERDGVLQIEGMFSDVSDRKKLEETFRHAQKMEAIGQLTGGIAHDFNNILAAILANSHFLIEDLGENDPRRADAEEIRAAAERAASLTRQLLAFSRRQVLEPTVVDLNVALGGIEKMLGRLIGEDIELSVQRSEQLGSVRVDVGQLEQVVVNLVVNARDAMPSGGKIIIETANAVLGAEYMAGHVGATPGEYVVVSVSDTGSGMDAETRRRIFEPFYTTKEEGKGTGLGLSTCYGIVQQSGGYIWVYSEPGQGTVFKIYLPRVDAQPDEARKRSTATDARGTETVLLVEDDARVRTAVGRILEGRGYRVLRASDRETALQAAARHEGPIHLVLSDVVMPGSSGPEVVRELREKLPAAGALLMSGYTDHAVLRSGALDGGVGFIQKPFTPAALARKVRDVLDDRG